MEMAAEPRLQGKVVTDSRAPGTFDNLPSQLLLMNLKRLQRLERFFEGSSVFMLSKFSVGTAGGHKETKHFRRR